MQTLREYNQKYGLVEKQYQSVCGELQELQGRKQLRNSLKQKKELKEHEFELLQKRMANNPHFKVIQHVEDMIQQHSHAKESMENAKAKLEEMQQKIVSIEKEMMEFNNNRETKLKSLQDRVKKGKKELTFLQPTVVKMQEQIMLSKAESQQLEMEMNKLIDSINHLEQSMTVSQGEDVAVKKEIFALETKQNQLNVQLKEEKKSLVKYDKELQQCELQIQQKTQQWEDAKLERQQLKIEIENATSNLENIKHQVQKMEKQNTWIRDQKQYYLTKLGYLAKRILYMTFQKSTLLKVLRDLNK
jgi:structural maintenance of chromosome 2